jgi:hypothetical protein
VEILNAYEPRQGYVTQNYVIAVDGYANSDNGVLERVIYFGLALAAALPTAAESMVTGFYNAPNSFLRGTQELARANTTPEPEEQIEASLTAVRDFADAITGILGPFSFRTPKTPEANAPAPTTSGQNSSPSGEFYSVAFETKLDPSVFGRSDKVHFNRANAALDDALCADPEFAARMQLMSPGIAGRVSSVGGRQNPLGFTWHHDFSPGVLQLVPTVQHTPGSIFWRTFHPDPGAAGGYSIWAIPAGAPKR